MKIERIHASCVALGTQGVLLLGESAAGKSDLVLRLVDRGAKLVADDHVELFLQNKQVFARSPDSIAGLLEIRGVGIFKVKSLPQVKVHMAVQLTKREWIERLPYPEPFECLGHHTIAQVRLCAFEASAAIKVEMAAAALQDGSMTVGAFKE